MKILLFGLASSIHSKEYYAERYRRVIDIVSKTSSITYIDEPIVNTIELSNEYDLYIAFYLTGGTSRLSYEILSRIKKPVILIASGEHNALASALTARSRLSSINVKNYLLIYSDESELDDLLKTLVKSIDVINELRNLRILEINETGRVSDNGLKYVERNGGCIEAIGFNELINRADKVSVEDAREIIDNVVKNYNVSENTWVLKIAKLIKATEDFVKERNYRIVSIDCFPLIVKYGYTPCILVSYLTSRGTPVICENDYYSLPLMYISMKLTNYSGWISNPSGYVGSYLRFAHCTLALDSGFECKAVDHFESNKPYGVACKYRFRNVLLARFSQDYSVLRIYQGRVVESGLLSDKYCRTQVVVEIPGFKPLDFYREALGNHYVFIPYVNDLIKHLEIISWWMNWKLEVRN